MSRKEVVYVNDEQWVEFMYEGRRDGFSLGSSQHYDRHHEQHLPKLFHSPETILHQLNVLPWRRM